MGEKDHYALVNPYATPYFNPRVINALTTEKPCGGEEIAELERELSIKMGLCDGFLILTKSIHGEMDLPTPEEIERFGGNLLVFFRTNNPYHVLRARERGMGVAEYVDMRVREILNLMNALPKGRFWWLIGGEQWNSHHLSLKSEDYSYSTKEEAYQWYKEWVTTDKHQLHWKGGKFKENWDPGVPSTFRYLRERGMDLKNLNIGGGGATPMDVHYQHEWGLKLSFIEVFSSCPCTQISIAFARGAARQYDAYWSIYHPPISHPAPTYDGEKVPHIRYNSEVKRLGGPTESMLLRCWVVAHFSGNNVNYMDGAPYVNWIEKEKDKLELTLAGRNAKRFADLILKERTERGETYVPVALMLNFYHGWTPGRGEYLRGGKDVTWYKISFNAGDYMVENFFNTAFLDNSLMGKPRPWSTSEEYGRMLLNGFDFRPYEFRCVTASRWGDSFDVILDNASLETLKKYKVVMLLGDIVVGAPLLDKLKRYVEDGGILLGNIEQLSQECRDAEFFGVSFTDQVRKSTRSLCQVCGRRYQESEYDYTVIKGEGAKVEATSEAGDPLVTVNRVGEGQVILTTPYYLLSYRPEQKMEVPIDRMVLRAEDFPSDAPLNPERKALIVPYNRWLNVATDAIDHLMERVSLIEVNGPPIEYIVNQVEERGIIIVLVNNEDCPWRGDITIKKEFLWECYKIEEWWKGERCSYSLRDKKLTIHAVVPEFGLRIYGIGQF